MKQTPLYFRHPKFFQEFGGTTTNYDKIDHNETNAQLYLEFPASITRIFLIDLLPNNLQQNDTIICKASRPGTPLHTPESMTVVIITHINGYLLFAHNS